MTEIELKLSERKQGAFRMYVDKVKVGELFVSVDGPILTAIHTEVGMEYEGRGYARQLVDAAVEYARENGLQIVPMCPYVQARFMKNAEYYADVWKRDEE